MAWCLISEARGQFYVTYSDIPENWAYGRLGRSMLPPKRLYLSIKLHGVTKQNLVIHRHVSLKLTYEINYAFSPSTS
jgi:hypothetical protein